MLKRIVNLLKQLVNNKVRIILCAILFLFGLVFLITNSFAASVPVKSIEIKSENLDYDTLEQGAWKVTKSASWISKGKARITFNIDSVEKNDDKDRDIILVIDNSASMYSGNFSNIKQNLINVLTSLTNNTKVDSIALISFNDTATILSEFTNDFDYISNLVNDINPTGNTNYYQAFVKVDDILSNYNYNNSKTVDVIFLTDGYPNVDIPNEVSQYTYLKSQYSYINISAIQYGMGEEILDAVKNISDKQFLATDITMENVLHKLMFNSVKYDNFEIIDNVNDSYFSIDKVSSSLGNVNFNDNKVVWNITSDDMFYSGDTVTININISLKNDVNFNDLYNTNSSESIVSKIGNIEENISSSKSPILAGAYTVSYLGNASSGCSVSNVPSDSKYLVYDNVSISSNIPVCFGYQFKGWEFVTSDINKIGDSSFVMPGFDVTLKATWSKVGLNKSMDGTVEESVTLYKVVKNEALSNGLAKEYTGSHQDSVNGIGQSKIYYYYATSDDEGTAILNKNNVLFAGMCWQMIRTTDTGGVKMIYNGEPDLNGACGTDRDTHVGTTGLAEAVSMPENIYYGTSYTYNSSSSTFSLSGSTTKATWSDSTYKNLIGKYTCLTTSTTGCSRVYYVDEYDSSTTADLISLTYVINYSYIGLSQYNLSNDSPSYVGYMYNSVYPYKKFTSNSEVLLKSATLSTSYYYASNYTYTASTGTYKLSGASKVSSTSNYSSLKGKYTLLKTSSSSTRTSLFYIADVSGSTMLYIELTNGNALSSYQSNYTYGSFYTDNGDGTYTINSPTTIKNTDWYSNYSNVNGKYLCKNASNNTCSSLLYVTLATATKINYVDVNNMNYKYANSFTYQNGQYTLSGDSTTFWNISDSNNYNKLDNAHYTCLNDTGVCSSIAYIYMVKPPQANYYDATYLYIILDSGNDINDALNEMLYADDVNKYDSTMKKMIELWYKNNLNSYSKYIEDTIYCNDRSISNLHGWNSNNGSVTESEYLEFNEFNTTSNLYCSNVTDRFSVSNEKAKLNYSVGLMSSAEMNLLNNSKARVIDYFNGYWLMSPAAFYFSGAMQKDISTSDLAFDYVEFNNGIRPAISLVSGTTYVSGDGSMTSPYVVPTN